MKYSSRFGLCEVSHRIENITLSGLIIVLRAGGEDLLFRLSRMDVSHYLIRNVGTWSLSTKKRRF